MRSASPGLRLNLIERLLVTGQGAWAKAHQPDTLETRVFVEESQTFRDGYGRGSLDREAISSSADRSKAIRAELFDFRQRTCESHQGAILTRGRTDMHEIGIIQSALDIATKAAKASGAARVHRLELRVGAMTGVVREALEFAFEVARKGTPAQDASLVVQTVPATCWCGACEEEFAAADFICECPKCHNLSPELRRGLELEVASVEVS